jgi:hypothetical protein
MIPVVMPNGSIVNLKLSAIHWMNTTLGYAVNSDIRITIFPYGSKLPQLNEGFEYALCCTTYKRIGKIKKYKWRVNNENN